MYSCLPFLGTLFTLPLRTCSIASTTRGKIARIRDGLVVGGQKQLKLRGEGGQLFHRGT